MHGIKEHDVQEGRNMAWHGLTRINPELTLENSWLSTWDVVAEKLKMEVVTGDTTEMVETPFSILRASDLPEVQIGKPFAGSYVPVTNKRLIEVAGRAIQESNGAKLASAGTVHNRARTYLSFEIDEIRGFEAAGRKFETFLNFGDSRDGSCPLWVNTSNICTVCNNTFNANLHDKTNKAVQLKVKHTKNSDDKIENMVEIIEAVVSTQNDFAEKLNGLAGIKIKHNDANAFIAGWLLPSDMEIGTELSTRASNTIEQVQQLFISGAGNKGENLADLFSAFTDYYSHTSSGGESPMKQFISSEFGIAGIKKQEMFAAILDAKVRKAIIKRGSSFLV